MKLSIEDLQVSTFVPAEDDMQVAAYTGMVATCRIQCQSGGGGQMCVTYQYETCETGPVYYC